MAGVRKGQEIMLTMLASAKLNLTLEVLAKRPDGYHEVRTVLQAISLYDELRFEPAPDLVYKSGMVEWVPERSLVFKAASLIRKSTGYSSGALIEVVKRIPLLSGLGGDSSDAVATLHGLNNIWGLGLSRDDLIKMAEQLGSDVPFFLYDGTSLAEGRGEKVTPLPHLPHMWVIVVVPAVPRQPGKTAQLYASLKTAHFSNGQITAKFVEGLREGKFDPASLFNTFENVAFERLSELDTYRKHIIKIGADNVHLAGSGPSLFTMVREKDRAEDLLLRIKQQDMEAYMVESL